MTGLVMIVPTRSRPASVWRLVQAWCDTGAFDDGGRLLFAADADDPQWEHYRAAVAAPGLPSGVEMVTADRWRPMVQKLNAVAVAVCSRTPPAAAVGFAGDDHVPRTRGWVGRCVAALAEMGTGIVYGADGYQDDNIPTWWTMTPDIVQVLGMMVPAPVEHLYCDNAMRLLGDAAGCLRYLPDVLVEHMNPYADGKGEMDAQYRRVNSTAQYRRDSRAFAVWRRRTLRSQAEAVRGLANP